MKMDEAELKSRTHKRFGEPLEQWMDKQSPDEVIAFSAAKELADILPQLLENNPASAEAQKMLRLGTEILALAAGRSPEVSAEIASGLECLLAGIAGLANEVACLSIEKEAACIVTGHINGSKPKRRKWAELTAIQLQGIAGAATELEAWRLLPAAQDPWSIETDAADFDVYVDGDTLVAVDPTTLRQVGTLARTSFFRRYYKKLQPAGQ